MSNAPKTMLDLAESAYQAYGNVVQWRAFNGDRMPDWQMLPVEIKMAWCAAASCVREEVLFE